MAWVKLDDRFYTNRKVLDAGRDARELYLVGLTYCAGNLSDGFIPDTALPALAVTVDVTVLPIVSSCATRLVMVGLWESAEGGYRVHDYLNFNPSAAHVRAEREATRQRVTDWRRQRKAPAAPSIKEGSNASRNGVTSAGVTPHVTPLESRTPVTIPAAKAAGARAREVESVPVTSWQADLFDAFAARGLSPPSLAGAEGKAARSLAAALGAENLACCWREIAAGEYGDEWLHANLSFAALLSHNRGANWLLEKAGKTRAPHRNGHVPPETNITRIMRGMAAKRAERTEGERTAHALPAP